MKLNHNDAAVRADSLNARTGSNSGEIDLYAELTAFAATQLVIVKILFPLDVLAAGALTAALPVGVLAFAPLTRLPKWLLFLEPRRERVSADDSLIVAEDLVKYSHGELIFKLDKYLGGGITATQYALSSQSRGIPSGTPVLPTWASKPRISDEVVAALNDVVSETWNS